MGDALCVRGSVPFTLAGKLPGKRCCPASRVYACASQEGWSVGTVLAQCRELSILVRPDYLVRFALFCS